MRFSRPGRHAPAPSGTADLVRDIVLVIEALTHNSYFEASVHELVRRGWRVTVVGLAGPDEMTRVLTGVLVVDLGSRGAHDFPRASWRLRQLLRRLGPSGIVHAFDDIPTVVAAPAVAGRAGWRLVNHRHHVETPLSWYWPRLARATGAPVMACSRTAARAAISDGFPEKHVHLAVNGAPSPRLVAPAETATLRGTLGLHSDDILVALVARLRPEKGHAFLLDALEAMAPPLLQRVVVGFIGDGPVRGEVAHRVAASSARVVMVGHEDDIGRYYAAADVVAVPSAYESFGLVAAEAMAAGKPVVASRIDGLSEVVGDGGVLVARDQAAWTAALSTVLTDEALRHQLGAAGRARYERNFTIARMVDRWETVYADVARVRDRPDLT